MIDGLDVLKDIGAQKIHETTHISKQHVQAIIHGSFEDINKIQFMGFVSILEKEYELDLSSLRNKGLEYFRDVTSYDNPIKSVFVVPEKKRSNKSFFVFIIIIIFLSVVSYKFYPLIINNETKEMKIDNLNNDLIDNAKKIIVSEKKIDKKNILINSEQNISNVLNNPKKKVLKVKKSKTIVKIEPRTKVWMGYIDLETHEKHQKVLKNIFTLDTSKNWIIVFGHSNINVEVNGVMKKYSSNKNLRFIFKDGKLEQINYKKFKKLNEGKEW